MKIEDNGRESKMGPYSKWAPIKEKAYLASRRAS
jgi:hypothetical protein